MNSQDANETAKKKELGGQEHPSGDNRFKFLDATIRKNQSSPDALIEVLHTAQELFGYLRDDILIYITQKLKLPPSRVYGVATFYNFFSLKPKGEHCCIVCMGTACYVKGAAEIVNAVEKHSNVKAGEVTSDGKYSLLTARCVGACGIAPAVVFDGNMAGYQTPESVLEKIKGWYKNGSI